MLSRFNPDIQPKVRAGPFDRGGVRMPLITEKDRKTIREWFEGLTEPVRLIVFTQEHECQFCEENRLMAEEVASLSDLVTVEIYDFVHDEEVAQEYDIDKIPAIAIVSDQDYGVRYFGFPGGYEFTTLVEDVISVSTGEHGLSENSLKMLEQLDHPVHLQVFITPT
jgi:glutaredoxin-like protein